MATFEAYPYKFLHLKVLLLRKQYHQCINASTKVLSSLEASGDNHPLSGIYATFYLALAYDELARSMHEHSAFKIAAFNTAEQNYRQAIKLLPSLEQCRGILSSAHREAANGESGQSQSLGQETEQPPRAVSALVTAQRLRDELAQNDDSDLESRDSFDDFSDNEAPRLALPHRPLQRDYSSMSLLTAQPRLTKSTSQGLLRPIRPGSPPKAHHLPPKLPYVGKDHSSQSSRCPSPLPKVPDVAVTSPPDELVARPVEIYFDLARLSEHLDGMHTQITTHISLLHRAKLVATVAQTERASRSIPSRSSPQKRVPKSKSFWSFTPVNVKLAEKQKKIEEGRARGWERKRYRPEKYDALVDDALAEL